MALRELFPAIEPYVTGMLPVDDIHTLYWEESGNPDGLPVLYLHGGPGEGANPIVRRFFDPTIWRVILFDQRGAGRSTPLFETRDNTTFHLIADIERLRVHRKIEQWHLLGGSWGCTLALAYAQQYADRCLSLILRSVCLLRRVEVNWFLYGLRTIFPEAWAEFAGFIAPNLRDDLLEAYHRIFQGPDDALRREAVRLWLRYESCCSSFTPLKNPSISLVKNDPRCALPILEAHYFKNNLFNPDSLLLDNLPKIRHIPAIIVQGRYDMVCPMVTADEVHRHWPEAEYRIVPSSGHAMTETGIRTALLDAIETAYLDSRRWAIATQKSPARANFY